MSSVVNTLDLPWPRSLRNNIGCVRLDISTISATIWEKAVSVASENDEIDFFDGLANLSTTVFVKKHRSKLQSMQKTGNPPQ